MSRVLDKRLIAYYWSTKRLILLLLFVVFMAAFTKTYAIFGDYFLVLTILEPGWKSYFITLLLIYLTNSLANFIFYTWQNYLISLNVERGGYLLECALINKIINLDYKAYNVDAQKSYLNLIIDNVAKINANFKEQLNFLYSLTFTVFSVVFLSFVNYYLLGLILAASVLSMVSFWSYYYANVKEVEVSKHYEWYLRKLDNSLATFKSFFLNNKLVLFWQKFNLASKQRFTSVMKTRIKIESVLQIHTLVDSLVDWGTISLVVVLWSYEIVPTALLLTSLSKIFNIKHNILSFFQAYRAKNQIDVFERSWQKFFTTKFNSVAHPASKFEFLEFQKVDLEYEEKGKKKRILKSFNLTLKRNEKLLLLGKSGSGKSSIVNLLLNRTLPTKGHIHINGKEYAKDTSVDHLISLCSNRVFWVEDTLDQIIASHSTKNVDLSKIQELKKICRINFLESTPPETVIKQENLSQGQQQRIAIAQTLYAQRDVLILDEALSNLDPNNRVEIFKEIMKLDVTLIFVSHHLSEEQKKEFDKIVSFDEKRNITFWEKKAENGKIHVKCAQL